MQEEFIEWLEEFSNEYIVLISDYYRNFNDNDSILENIYSSFNDIIDYEKKLSNRKMKSNSL